MTLGPLMVDIAGTELSAEDREVLAHPLVGSVILFSRNYIERTQLRALIEQIHSVRTPALLIAVDHEGGRVQRFRAGFSALPPLRRIGHAYDADPRQGLAMARALGWLMAAELLACGLDFSFAPCVDLDYGLSEIIGDRAFHARASVVAPLAVAYMHGMRDAGMAATAKHFPGHGAVVADSHLALPIDRRELMDLDEDLLPYRRLIANALPAVMVAHVLFPAVDAVPASFSPRWIAQELRQGLQFAGLVFADDLTMAAAAAIGDLPDRARRALAAGCDVLPVCNDRAGVQRLLDHLKPHLDPASQVRLIRMRGRKQPGFETLEASAAWRSAREWLARSAAKPELKFEPGDAETGGI
ncbi:MAG TPA: beta-N-acetylhexosaminidase [Steroidobacteraceae bacterium]|nr:beta-N-acetylhexosaminidase [Steroidobacteraceae bacterium]